MKILIIKTSSLGDILQSFPVINYLKCLYPDVQIDWVVESSCASLLEQHPDIHRLIVINTHKWRKQLLKINTWSEFRKSLQELSKEKYDFVFDLQGNIKSGIIKAFSHSNSKVGFGKRYVSEWPNLLFSHRCYDPPLKQSIAEDYIFLVEQAFKIKRAVDYSTSFVLTQEDEKKVRDMVEHPHLKSAKKVIVAFSSRWVNKQLSVKQWIVLLKKLQSKFNFHYLFIWGTYEERQKAENIALSFIDSSVVSDRLSIVVLQELMQYMDLVIAVDSFALHLAATTSTPTYSIFGASSSHKYKPLGMQHYALQGECPYGKKFEKRCPILRKCTTGACMKEIQEELLLEHFSKWWMHKEAR